MKKIKVIGGFLPALVVIAAAVAGLVKNAPEKTEVSAEESIQVTENAEITALAELTAVDKEEERESSDKPVEPAQKAEDNEDNKTEAGEVEDSEENEPEITEAGEEETIENDRPEGNEENLPEGGEDINEVRATVTPAATVTENEKPEVKITEAAAEPTVTPVPTKKPASADVPVSTPVPTVPAATQPPTPTDAPKAPYIDGIFSASAVCDDYDIFTDKGNCNYYVDVEVKIEGGRIVSVTAVNEPDMDYPENDDANAKFLARAQSKCEASIIEKQNADKADVVSGATYSSKAIYAAAKSALASAKNN